MTAILMGVIFILIGVWGMAQYFSDLMLVVRGFLPISLLLGGIVALVAGVSAFQSDRGNGAAKE